MLKQWWSKTNEKLLFESQENLIKNLVKSPFRITNSKLLNGIEFLAPNYSDKSSKLPTIILAHGFGSGAGFYFRNIDPILKSGKIGRVLLFDWLGMGASLRPKTQRPIRGFSDCSTRFCDSRFNPEEAVNFFIDPLDKWLEEENVNEKITLVGHSLGGFLTARYALKYPDKIEKLILASPVGITIPDKSSTNSKLSPRGFRLLDTLWSANFTPQQIVRIMGSNRGRNMVQMALQGRIPHLSENDINYLADYLYHITVSNPSGEYAMNSLLEPILSATTRGVFAREPLHDSLSENLASSIELKILFGDQDWMRFNEKASREVANNLLQRNMKASVDIIEKASHHLYIDNVPQFTKHLIM